MNYVDVSNYSGSLWYLPGLVGLAPPQNAITAPIVCKATSVASSHLAPKPPTALSPQPPRHRETLEKDGRFSSGLIQKYLNDYFSSYSEEISLDDELVFKTLSSLLRRIVNVEKAIEKILPLLNPDDILSSHRPLPEAVLLILNNKIALDHCLQRIKLGDLHRAHQVGNRNEIKKALIAVYDDLHRIDTIKLKSIESSLSLATQYGDASQLQDFFHAFYVYPLSFEEEGEQWAVIDMRKVDPKDRPNVLKFFTREQMEKDLGFRSDCVRASCQRRKPGSVLSYNLDHGKPRKCEGANAKNGAIQLFYEERKKTADSHGDRNVGGRTRLETVSTDREGEPLGLVKGDTYRATKASEGMRGGWTEDRRRTAAVDRLQAIWTVRLLVQKILTQGIEAVSSNEILNAYRYMRSVQAADLGSLPGSYLQDSVFTQATTQMALIEERLKAAVATKKSVARWVKGLESSGPQKLTAGVQSLGEIRSVFENWKKGIDQFVDLIADPRYKNEKLQLSWFLERFQQVSQGLDPLISLLNEAQNKPTDSSRIRQALNVLRNQFDSLRPLVWELSLAYEEPFVRDRFCQQIENTQSQELKTSSDLIFPSSFQVPNRVSLCLETLFSHCSGCDFKVEILKTRDVVCEGLDRIESLRLSQLKALQSCSREAVLRRFFPHYQISTQERVKSWGRNRGLF